MQQAIKKRNQGKKDSTRKKWDKEAEKLSTLMIEADVLLRVVEKEMFAAWEAFQQLKAAFNVVKSELGVVMVTECARIIKLVDLREGPLYGCSKLKISDWTFRIWRKEDDGREMSLLDDKFIASQQRTKIHRDLIKRVIDAYHRTIIKTFL